MEQILKQLKQARLQKKLSQAALGERVGLPQAHICKIETGKTDLRLSSLLEIARNLDHELMLVPLAMTDIVRYTLHDKGAAQKPRWQVDLEDDN